MAKNEIQELLDWVARMPDAGFNENSPRWAWWSEGAEIRQRASEAAVAQGEALAAAQQENERLRRELRNAMPSQYPLERTVIRSRAEHPGGEQ